MKRDFGLDVLLDMDGESFYDESGYWWKICVRRVIPTPERPHGLEYRLTLHDRSNQRILGFDNAHPVRLNAKGKLAGRYRGRIVAWDHQHRSSDDQGTAYEFSSAQQLLQDFFTEVNAVIKNAENQ